MPGWQELLDHLGGHALAIELAGAFLAESPGMTPKSYLALLSAGGESQAVADLVRYGRTVRQALEATWQRLDSEEKSSWCLAACFAPEKVLPPISNAVGLTPEKLMPLRRYHLIEEEEPAGAWRMHRLVRSFCGTREESVSAFKRFVKACDEFSKPYQWGDDPRWLTQHLAHLEQSSEDRDLAEYPPGLLRRLALLRVSLGDFACAQERLEHGLRLDFDQEDKTLFRVSLALVLQGQGDFPAARALLEETLKTVLHKHGEKHPKVAMCRSNLGTVLKNQGDLTGARVLLEKALADYLDSLGEKHPSVAVCRSNLATVLQDQGDLPGARELLEKALAADLEVYGEKHPTVAIRRSNLATVLEDQGDLTGAKDLLEKALAVDLEIHGKRHPKVAIRKGLLGRVLAAQGLLNRAKSFSEEALQTFENTLGADHPYCETARRDLEEILNQMRG
ncbi:MAG: tetratricopeptide repeat protein [Acidobacteriota bacterium]